jgi:hypothetical protein
MVSSSAANKTEYGRAAKLDLNRFRLQSVAKSLVWEKGKDHRRDDANEGCHMIPADLFAEIEIREHAKDRERDDFLDDFQLER